MKQRKIDFEKIMGNIHTSVFNLFIKILKMCGSFLLGVLAFVIASFLAFWFVGLFMPELPDINSISQLPAESPIGLDVEPIYELGSAEIEGARNAYNAIEGIVDSDQIVDKYSKKEIKVTPLWDNEDPDAKGEAVYVGYGFLKFNYISNLEVNDVLVFPNVNFGDMAPRYISIQIAKLTSNGGVVSFYIDNLSEKSIIAIFDVSGKLSGNGKDDFFRVVEAIGRGKKITGCHKVYMVVEQSGIDVGDIKFGK